MLELFGQMPAPQLGDGRVGRLQNVVDLLQKKFRLGDPRALEPLAVREVPLD
jgi:hypothetical protein